MSLMMSVLCVETDLSNGNNTEQCLLHLATHLAEIEKERESASRANLSFFLLVAAFNIFLMQVGFAMLEVGIVQTKNAKSVLFKNIIDCCAGALIWWSWGYGLSVGTYRVCWKNHFSHSLGLEKLVYFFHSYTFSTTCATIVSGGVVERMSFSGYMVISITMVGLIYPVVVSWVWNEEGWLYKMGYIDFAGVSVVHALGGVATLVATYNLGPRIGRFLYDEESHKWTAQTFQQHSAVFSNLGTFILFYGWMSFNASSTLGIEPKDFERAVRAVINSLLSGATSCVVGSLYFRKREGVHSLEKMHNYLLIGLVSVTGCCAYMDIFLAPVVGLLAPFVYDFFSSLMIKLRVDDPLDAVAVHMGGGVWGTFATGLFLKKDLLGRGQICGVIYGGGKLILLQLMGILVILGWGATIIGFILFILKQLSAHQKFPPIRAERDAELLGLDFAYYDGFLFPELNKAAITRHNESKAAKTRVIARQLRQKQNGQPSPQYQSRPGLSVETATFRSNFSNPSNHSSIDESKTTSMSSKCVLPEAKKYRDNMESCNVSTNSLSLIEEREKCEQRCTSPVISQSSLLMVDVDASTTSTKETKVPTF